MEAENTALAGHGRILPALESGFKDPAQQNSCVFELLGHRGLYIEVVAETGAQRVVLPGARVKGRRRALDTGPVKHISSAPFLFPVAQPMLKVALQLWSCETENSVKLNWQLLV